MDFAIPEDNWQDLGALAFEEVFHRGILNKGHGLLAKIKSLDFDAVGFEHREHRRKADKIGIDVGAADAGRAAHRRVVDLDGFHIAEGNASMLLGEMAK